MSFSSPPALHPISSSAHDAYSQDSDDYMDQPGDNVPASSSPVSSSPPWPATPPDATNQANSSVVPGSPPRKSIYASETGASSYFSSLPGTRDTTVDTKNSLNRSDGHVGDVDTDSTQDFEDSEDDEEYWDNDEDSGASSYPRSLESRAAQTVFSSQLNALLEEVLRSRHVFEESNSGSLDSGSQPLPSVDSSGSSQQSKILASHYPTSSLGSGLESYTRTIASNTSSMPRSSSSSSAEVLACSGSPHLSVSCTVSPDFNSLSPTISRVSRQMMAFKADHEDEAASPSSQCSEESTADENREPRPSVLHVSSRISAASRIPLRTPSTHVTNRPGIPSAPKKIPQKVGYNIPAIQAPKRHHPDSADVRVIHPSLSTPQSRLDAGTQQTVEIAQPLKKRKITSESKTTLLSPFCLAPDGDTTTSTSNHFRLSSARAQSSKDVSKLLSTKPASLRKAASLRSESSFSGDEVPKALRTIVEEEEEKTPVIIHKGGPSAAVRRDFPAVSNARPSTTNDMFPPTQPVTPAQQPREIRSKKERLKTQTEPCPLPYPLPIIGPPPFCCIPRAPSSKEEVAERRIGVMVMKEAAERQSDNMPFVPVSVGGNIRSGCMMMIKTKTLDEEEERMWRDVGEIVLPDEDDDDDDDADDSKSMDIDSDEDDEDVSEEESEEEVVRELRVRMCIDDEFRVEAVKWMLKVVPPTCPNKANFCAHLRRQLEHSPDTRWHATHLFTRYFVQLGISPSSSPIAYRKSSEKEDMNIDYDGEREIVWDVAVACLALSVKFHRDVLSPLYPVLADEFLLLSPNEMTYEDLESAQRDVFAGLDFNLGSFTPEAYMSEFYDALPSLRKSVQFKGGWDVVRKDTWSILLKTLHDINYLQFPISLLTASALVLSLTRTLTLKARIEQATVLSTRVDKWKPSIFNGSNCDCERLRRGARKVVRAVELDLREILGVEIESWRRCRRWIHEVSEV